MTLRMPLGLSAFAFAAIAACSSPERDATTVVAEQPAPAGPAEDWPGPPVHATFLADGSLRIVMTTPTGGHTFAVESVDATRERATIRCAHTPPVPDAIVTQVVTEHAVLVDAAKLPSSAREVVVSCSTPGPDGKPMTREVWKQAR